MNIQETKRKKRGERWGAIWCMNREGVMFPCAPTSPDIEFIGGEGKAEEMLSIAIQYYNKYQIYTRFT